MRSIGKSGSITTFIIGLSFISILYLFQNRFISIIGTAALSLLIGLSIILVVTKLRSFAVDRSFDVFIIITLYMLFIMIMDFSANAAYKAFQLIMLLFLYTVYEHVRITSIQFNFLKRAAVLLSVFLFITYLILFLLNQMRNQTVFSPTLIKLLLPISMYYLDFDLKNKRKLIWPALLFLFAFIIGERTMSLCFIVIFFVYNYLSKKKKPKNVKIIYWIICGLLISFPFLYVWVSYLPIRKALDLWALQRTGGRIFSGRNVIWDLIIQSLNNNHSWLTGLGLSNQLFLDNNITLSPHNVYMYLLRDGGMILVVLFALFLSTIWNKTTVDLNDKNSRITAAYLIGMMVMMTFEVFLVANNVVVSVFWWMALSFRYRYIGEESIVNERKNT